MSRDTRNKPDSPEEAEAVRTTIVGGQPPREGRSLGDVPRGVEVLIKKAAVDPAFKKMLLEKRARAAEAISLTLSPAEEAMLEAVPEAQLRAIVANTKVSPGLRPAFLGYAAGAMLAALTAKAYGDEANVWENVTIGISPDIPPELESFDGVYVAEGTCTIVGRILDGNNRPLNNVSVKIRNTDIGTTSGVEGNYVITKIPPGEYDISATYLGFEEKISEDVTLIADKITIIVFTLTEDNQKPDIIIKGITPDRP
jgi:hypothetical protein